jgi:hypothetical protein
MSLFPQSYGVSAPTYLVGGALSTDFTACVDDCAAKGLTWIRFGANEDVIMVENLSNLSGITWNTANLAVLDAAINYVVAKGMRVFLYLPPPTYFTTHATMAATGAGATAVTLERVDGLQVGQTVTIGAAGVQENRVIFSIVGTVVTFTAGMTYAHAAYTPVYYTATDYKTLLTTWARFLAQRWAGKIGVWQIFNENNVHDFKGRGSSSYSAAYTVTINGGGTTTQANTAGNIALAATEVTLGIYYQNPNDTVPQLDQVYLREVADCLSTINMAIKVYDTAGATAINVGARDLPYDAVAQAQYLTWFAQMSPYVDAIAMDQYDGDPTTQATKIAYLNAIKALVINKKFYIAEFGWFWSGGGNTQATQSAAIATEMATYQGSNVDGMLLYQYKDEATSPSFYGIIQNTGTHNTGYNTFFNSIQPPGLVVAPVNTLERPWSDSGGYDRDVLEKARYEQTALLGTNYRGPVISGLALADAVPFDARHLEVNGSLSLDVRNTPPYNAESILTIAVADGWAGNWGTWTPETTIVDKGSKTSLKVVMQSANKPYMFQQITHPEQYSSSTVNLSARCFGPGECVWTGQYTAGGVTRSFSGRNVDTTAGWTTVRAQVVLPANVTMLLVQVNVANAVPAAGGTTFYFDNIAVNVGPWPISYTPQQPGTSMWLAKERYWQARISHRFQAKGVGDIEVIYIPFPITTTATPPSGGVTTSNTSPSVYTNVSGVTLTMVDNLGAYLTISSAGAGACIYVNQTFTLDMVID